MDHDNRRQAVRIECDLPVRVEGEGGTFHVRLLDLSRTGLRLRVSGELLGIHRLSSLAQITRRIGETLGEAFSAELHYEMLGPLVRKELRATRIAKLDWEQTDVEVGCLMVDALTDEEAGMLGVPLPKIGDADAPDDLQGTGPRHRTPSIPSSPARAGAPERDPFVVWLYPEPGKSSKPLRTETLSLARGVAKLGVGKRQGWDLEQLPVARVMEALDDAYGTDILIRIVDGDDDVWAGPAEIQEVDVTPTNCDIRLGVSFGRELRAEELGRLGLPTPA